MERVQPTSRALSSLQVGADVGNTQRLASSHGRAAESSSSGGRPSTSLHQAEALLAAGHFQAALDIQARHPHLKGPLGGDSASACSPHKDHKQNMTDEEMAGILRKAMAAPLGSKLHGNRLVTEYARKYGSAGGAAPAATLPRRYSSGAVVATAPPPEFMASLKDKAPEVNSKLFNQLKLQSGSLSRTPAALHGTRLIGRQQEHPSDGSRHGTSSSSSSSAPRPHKAVPYKPGMVMMPPGTPVGNRIAIQPSAGTISSVGSSMQRPPTSGGRLHFNSSRPGTANPITHELLPTLKAPSTPGHSGPQQRAVSPNFFKASSTLAPQMRRLQTAGPAGPPVPSLGPGRTGKQDISSGCLSGTLPASVPARPGSTPAAFAHAVSQTITRATASRGGSAVSANLVRGNQDQATGNMHSTLSGQLGSAEDMAPPLDVELDVNAAQPPGTLAPGVANEGAGTAEQLEVAEASRPSISRPDSSGLLSREGMEYGEAALRMATPNPFAQRAAGTPGLPPRPPATGQLPPRSTSVAGSPPTGGPGPATPGLRPDTAASDFSTAGLALGRPGGMGERPTSACADSVDLAFARIRAENDRGTQSINIFDDTRSEMDTLSLSEFGIKEPSSQPGWQGVGTRKVQLARTKHAASIAAAKRKAQRALTKQAAPMVLNLQNLVDSTPEVLEMELGKMTFDELLDLDAKVTSGQ